MIVKNKEVRRRHALRRCVAGLPPRRLCKIGRRMLKRKANRPYAYTADARVC